MALRAMEELGYVRLEQRPDNRKNIYVFLSARGRKLKSTLVPLAEKVNALALKGLSARDTEVVRRALLAMIDNLARDPATQK
jgi:DNA-binding MarR family transcriptional regulator